MTTHWHWSPAAITLVLSAFASLGTGLACQPVAIGFRDDLQPRAMRLVDEAPTELQQLALLACHARYKPSGYLLCGSAPDAMPVGPAGSEAARAALTTGPALGGNAADSARRQQ